MNRKVGAYNDQQTSKIIELSVNYKHHRRIIDNMKPAINMPTIKNIKKVDKLTNQKIRYGQQARSFKLNEMQKQNNSVVQRISKIQSVYKQVFNPQHHISSQNTANNSRSISRGSLHSCSSERSVGSNFRRRTLRYKEIKEQNIKMAQRITHPKKIKDLKINALNKAYEKEQEYMRIRSRFSQRSKSIMQSLALGSLKLSPRDVQYLPQIRSPISQKYSTLNLSKDKSSRKLLQNKSKQKIEQKKQKRINKISFRQRNKSEMSAL